MFKSLSIRNKIIILLLIIGILPMVAIGIFTLAKVKYALEATSVSQLTIIREAKKEEVENYFDYIRDQISELATEESIIRAMVSFSGAFPKIVEESGPLFDASLEANIASLNERYLYQVDKTFSATNEILKRWWPEEKMTQILQYLYVSSNPNPIGEKDKLFKAVDDSTYTKLHSKHHKHLRAFLERKIDYYDIFFIEPEGGYIVYSAYKELDFATSLNTGPYKDSGLARAYRAALKVEEGGIGPMEDFAYYEPSYNLPSAFIASPIYDDGAVVGVLAVQIGVGGVDDIMTSNRKWSDVGFGNSVESYLVGADETMRSDSRLMVENSKEYFSQMKAINYPVEILDMIRAMDTTILLQEVSNEGTRAALSGKTGTGIFNNYKGECVLSAYTPLNIEGLNWVLMSEVEEDEAFKAVGIIEAVIFLAVIFVAFVVIVTGFLVGRSFAGPIMKVSMAAEEIGRGAFDKEIEVDLDDEIGILAKSFNQMVRELKKTQSELLRNEKLVAVGQLAGSVGHDLRNPLGVISNSIYFLRMKLKGDKFREDKKIEKHLDILDREISRSNHIISDLLDFSRPKDLVLEDADINSIIKGVLINHNIPKEVTLDSSFDIGIGKQSLDAAQMERVFTNLLVNALAAMEGSAGRLTISTRVHGDLIRVTISDTGSGIEADIRSKIFEPLFTTKAKGTGLGLAIVVDIVKKHGGSIDLESEPGKGAVFIVDLPRTLEKD